MNLHRHSWTRWVPYENFTDISWGGHVPSTIQIRRCRRCGLVKKKDLYGVRLPIDDRAIDEVLGATVGRRKNTTPKKAAAA